ncbi:MAG: hypothetical protein M3144_12320 [Actinomycetota bacterium]|nr:hypothetical protein [Actinomycetota bacterium]
MTSSRARAGQRERSVTARFGADRVVRWVVRGLWVALPFTAGSTLGDALADASRPVQVVANVGLWLGWALGVVATAVALPVSLTVLRVLAPAALAAVVAAAVAGHGSPLAVGWTAVTAGWVFSPALGALCVNGPAYPNERRFLLRPPGGLLCGPLALAWGLAVAGMAAGPLLLAAGRWVWGTVATVVGVPVAAVLLRGVHDLSRRWAVFVPAGLVLHDPLTVVDPVLLRRPSVTRLVVARRGTDAVDLTQRAPGLVLEIQLTEEVPLALVRPGQRLGEPVKASRLLITPTRPGALLEEARRRRFKVG